jgi:hypothetical protein
MIELVYVMLGGFAFVLTLTALLVPNDHIAVIAGVFSFLTWGVWSYASFSVEKGGASHEYPALAIVGLAFALLGLYIVATVAPALLHPEKYQDDQPTRRPR